VAVLIAPAGSGLDANIKLNIGCYAAIFYCLKAAWMWN